MNPFRCCKVIASPSFAIVKHVIPSWNHDRNMENPPCANHFPGQSMDFRSQVQTICFLLFFFWIKFPSFPDFGCSSRYPPPQSGAKVLSVNTIFVFPCWFKLWMMWGKQEQNRSNGTFLLGSMWKEVSVFFSPNYSFYIYIYMSTIQLLYIYINHK